MQKSPKAIGYDTIYATHYFERENTLQPSFELFSSGVHLDMTGDAFDDLLKFLMPNTEEPEREAKIKSFLESHYPDMVKAEREIGFPNTIMFLEIPRFEKEVTNRKHRDRVGTFIKNQALEVLASSTGDDSYYDYDPGFAYYIISLLTQLGTPKCLGFANKIQKVLNSRKY